MRRRLALFLLLAAAAISPVLSRTSRPAAAQLPAPTLALLATLPGEPRTTIHLVPVGARDLPPAIASIPHLPDAVLRAIVLPDRSLAVVADETPAVDLSFSASLLRVTPDGEVTPVCDRVFHASHPLAAGPRLFVERGRPGPDPTDAEIHAGRLRSDELTVEEITPNGPRVVHSFRGYTTHLAGFAHGKLLLYRVSPDGADLISLDPDSTRFTLLTPLAPFARDFSVDDRGRLLFAGRSSEGWTVERIDPSTGARELLATSHSGHAAPHAWPGAAAVWNPDGDPGLSSHLGPGVDVVRTISPDAHWAAALHYDPRGGIPRVVALRTDGSAAHLLPAPAGIRFEIAGFVR